MPSASIRSGSTSSVTTGDAVGEDDTVSGGDAGLVILVDATPVVIVAVGESPGEVLAAMLGGTLPVGVTAADLVDAAGVRVCTGVNESAAGASFVDFCLAVGTVVTGRPVDGSSAV